MIYAKLGGILAAVLACLALGYHFGEMPYKTKYEALQADGWKEKAQGEEAAKAVLAGQLVTAQTQQKVNSDAMQTLQAQNSAVAADRDTTLTRVHRLEQLLVGAARPTSGGLPQAQRGQDSSGTSAQRGAAEAEGLLIAAANECELNDNTQDALVVEVLPKVNAL